MLRIVMQPQLKQDLALEQRLLQIQISFSKFFGFNYKEIEEIIDFSLKNPDMARGNLKQPQSSEDSKKGWWAYIDDELKKHLEGLELQGYKPDYFIEETEEGLETRLNPKIEEKIQELGQRYINDERYDENPRPLVRNKMGPLKGEGRRNNEWKHWNQLMRGLFKEYDWVLEKSQEIADVIVDRQKTFIREGEDYYLEALTQADIAGEVGLHFSSVSRLLNGKTTQLPSGRILTLRSIVPGHSLDRLRSECVLKKVLEESPNLSAPELRDILHEKYGIDLARRTIHNYRSQLGYGASRPQGYDAKTAAKVYQRDVFDIVEDLKKGRLKLRRDGKISSTSLKTLYGGRK